MDRRTFLKAIGYGTAAAMLATLGCGKDTRRAPPEKDYRTSNKRLFNAPDAGLRQATPENGAANGNAAVLDAGTGPSVPLEERLALTDSSIGTFNWKNLRYPIATENIKGVELYQFGHVSYAGDHTIRNGLILLAEKNTDVIFDRDIFVFGDMITETKVLDAGDSGPEGFPQCGKYVLLQHTFSEKIKGINGHVRTLYCNLNIRDANTIPGRVFKHITDDNTTPGRVSDRDKDRFILGTVGSTGEGVKRPQLLFMVFEGSYEGYNSISHPFSVLRRR